MWRHPGRDSEYDLTSKVYLEGKREDMNPTIRAIQLTMGSGVALDFYLDLYTCLYLKIYTSNTFYFLGRIKHNRNIFNGKKWMKNIKAQ